MSTQPTVIVGMSGGVDSSVSALLLKQKGYNVIGLFMKNWEEKDSTGQCTTVQDYEDVAKVCNHIGIPYYTVNFVKEYWEQVFEETLEGFKAGHTPNPDILCNREIKFKALLKKATALGGNFLATGHYCQVDRLHAYPRLRKGSDPNKDQTYFLHAISGDALQQTLFPIGGMLKSEVRKIAREFGLPTAEKKDSTGVCFIGERNFKQFLSQFITCKPGIFENLEGKKIGQHDGVYYYTPGQRKGLGIGGPGDAWFVAKKDIERNVVVLVQGANHPALYSNQLTASQMNWINFTPSFPLKCKAKVRYRQPEQDCLIEKLEDGIAYVTFLHPQRAVTIRQSIVFYSDDICLGGGIINSVGPSYYELGLELPRENSSEGLHIDFMEKN